MPNSKEGGLQILEVIANNNLWFHYIGRENKNQIESVSGLSFSWNEHDDDTWGFTFGAKIDGVWNQHIVDVDTNDEEFSPYDVAVSLVKGVFDE